MMTKLTDFTTQIRRDFRFLQKTIISYKKDPHFALDKEIYKIAYVVFRFAMVATAVVKTINIVQRPFASFSLLHIVTDVALAVGLFDSFMTSKNLQILQYPEDKVEETAGEFTASPLSTLKKGAVKIWHRGKEYIKDFDDILRNPSTDAMEKKWKIEILTRDTILRKVYNFVLFELVDLSEKV